MEGAEATPINCTLCGKELGQEGIFKTRCKQEYHKSCLSAYSKKHGKCPSCNTACFEVVPTSSGSHGPKQTSVSKVGASAKNSGDGSESEPLAWTSTEAVGAMITEAVKSMQNEMMAQLSGHMPQFIQSNVAAQFRSLSLGRNTTPVPLGQDQYSSDFNIPQEFQPEERHTPRSQTK